MQYYPPWFDYAAWIIGGGGALFGFAMLSEPTGRKRGLLKLCCCVLVGIGVGISATGGILFNTRAPRVSVHGQIFHVVVGSNRSTFTTFRLRVPTGEIDELYLPGDIEQVRSGEVADVVYQAGSNRVIHLSVLDGPDAGYSRPGNEGTMMAVCSAIGAFALVLYGVMDFISDGTGYSSEPDDKAQTNSGVDANSLLDLNSPE